MPISIPLVTDLPFKLLFQTNHNQVNESSHMSIQNKETGEVISTGISTDTLTFTETSAKCYIYQTAEYICTATNTAGSIGSSPVKIFVNFSIIFYLVFFNNLPTNLKQKSLEKGENIKVIYINSTICSNKHVCKWRHECVSKVT